MKVDLEQIKEEIITKYEELKSSYKVASYFNTSATAVKRVLKDSGVLRTQKLAALERDNYYCGKYKRTEEHKSNLSKFAKTRTGAKNPFYGRRHTIETKDALSIMAQQRLAELNPNFKDGKYLRRPRDFMQAEFTRLRNFVFNRDNYTCTLTKIKGGNLHAHHVIPYWVCPEAYLDIENLITVSSSAHKEICHKGSWVNFNVELITDSLILKYNLDRERLNEIASLCKRM